MDLAAGAVTRSIDLPASRDEAWALLREARGLAGWLGDSVELDEVVAGAAGLVTEGDTVRRLVVTEVEEGRSIGFVWWDEAVPEEASIVTIALTPAADDATTVTVTERMAGAAHAAIGSASIGDLADAGAAWDRRLRALLGEPALAPAFV